MSFRSDVVNESVVSSLLSSPAAIPVSLVSCSIRPGVAKGVNYMGDIIEVQARAQVGHEDKNIHWMVKVMKPPSNALSAMFQSENILFRESSVYSKLVVAMSDLARDNNVDMPITCKLVHADQDRLVLEHMQQFGFRPAINQHQGLDLAHVVLVMRWLGAWHALAHVLLTRHQGGAQAWIADNPWAQLVSQKKPKALIKYREETKEFSHTKVMMIAKLVEADGPNGKEYAARYEKVANSLNRSMFQLKIDIERAQGPFNTLIHTDPWFNNMLFRYDTSDGVTPSDALLLDFQFVGYSHPGIDLAYFLLTSTTFDLRRDSLGLFLGEYGNALRTTAKACGVDVDYYNDTLIRADYRLGLNIALSNTILWAPTQLVEDEGDVNDFSQLDVNDKESVRNFARRDLERLKRVVEGSSVVRQRVAGMFEELIQEGII